MTRKKTKQRLIDETLSFIQSHQNHQFFAVTVRPETSFLKRFPWNQRLFITENLILNLIVKYQSHLTRKNLSKRQHSHLRIKSHNAIEGITKYGSLDTPHSHGVWGIPNELLKKWNTEHIHLEVRRKGNFKVEDTAYSLQKVIHSIEINPLKTNYLAYLLEEKNTTEGWLDYAYKGVFNSTSDVISSFVVTPI